MSDNARQIARFTAIFAGGTMLSRILGLARDIVVAGMIPTAARDMFIFAFRLPNMLRDMLGEGATNAAFIPVLNETQEKHGDDAYRELVRALLSVVLILFTIVTAIGVLLIPFVPRGLDLLRPFMNTVPRPPGELALTVEVMQWTFPYLFFIGLAVFAMAPLFTSKHYATPSWSPALLNVALIFACVVLRDLFTDPVWALVAGVWIGGIAQLVAMWGAMWKHVHVIVPSLRLAHPGIKKAFWLLTPVIFGQAAGEVNKLADSFFAYGLGDSYVSALYFANRLVQLPLSIFGIAVSVAILPSISRAAARDDVAEIRSQLMTGFRQTFFLTAPAVAGLLVLHAPIITLLFQRGEFDPLTAERASTALFYYTWGLLAFAGVKIAVQGFYAAQDTITPVVIASASMLLNLLLNFVLVGPMGYRGLALSTSIAFALNFFGLFLLLNLRYGSLVNRDFLLGLGRVILASVLMAALAYGLHAQLALYISGATFAGRVALTVPPIILGGIAFVGLAYLLRLPELRHFLDGISRRR